MNAAGAKPRPDLDADEVNLLVELLERALRELPAEIHHTRTTAYREQLRRRMDAADRLLARLKPLQQE